MIWKIKDQQRTTATTQPKSYPSDWTALDIAFEEARPLSLADMKHIPVMDVRDAEEVLNVLKTY